MAIPRSPRPMPTSAVAAPPSAAVWAHAVWGAVMWAAVMWAVVSCGRPAVADTFSERVAPFLERSCHACHRPGREKGELDLTRFHGDADVVAEFRRWITIADFIRTGEMPPDDAPQPALADRDAAVAAIRSILLVEARKTAGDPGHVPPRRLSNTEFDLAVRDLTGVPIRATAEFPPDPAGGEGFDNTGEALGMTPSLLGKYLGAARLVSEHLVLAPDGVVFAPFPVTSANERRALSEGAIIDFYERHEVDVAAYVEAAWRHRHRTAADAAVTLDERADRQGLSRRYLGIVHDALEQAAPEAPLYGGIAAGWRALPAPGDDAAAPPEVRALVERIEFLRGLARSREPALIQSNAGNWPIAHLALRERVAAGRDRFPPELLRPRTLVRFPRIAAGKPAATLFLRVDAPPGVEPAAAVILRRAVFSKADQPPRNAKETEAHAAVSLRSVLETHAPAVAERLAFGRHPRGGELDADACVVTAPVTIELPLSGAAVAAVEGRRLLVECELDTAHSRESAALVRGSDTPPVDPPAGGAELLLDPESRLAADVAAAGAAFHAAFPSRFYHVDAARGLAAGFHLVEGSFRDDRPLVEKVLDDAANAELDRLWRRLDFVTRSAETLLRGFVWFERAERHVLHDQRFDFLRAEDPALVEEATLSRFERLYLGKLGVRLAETESLAPAAPQPQFDLIHGFFTRVRAGLESHRTALAAAEPAALADLRRLAERAVCRPLRDDEAAAFTALYDRLRSQGQGVEEAARGVLVAILMTPDFFYRLPDAAPGDGIVPLGDVPLARRLAGLVWSALPDEELLAVARSGGLRDEATLVAQTRRMLRHPKVEAFAREFFGQWLRYRDYLAKDTLPAGLFPGYDATLRQAMFEEPTRLATHVIRADLPLDEFLFGDTTIVNEPLARLYGGDVERRYREQLRAAEREAGRGVSPRRPAAEAPSSPWLPVAGLRAAGRGGLVSMPVVLAKNSAGQRPSAVKRGFWVAHHLLGQHFPPPPADVPELPAREQDAAASLRDLLAAHTAASQCAMCHVHFDGLGLALEGFDAIGRGRDRDPAGRPIRAEGVRPGRPPVDGGARPVGAPAGGPAAGAPEGGAVAAGGAPAITGVGGVIEYVRGERRQELEGNLCRKFLGYALGRSVALSDEPLLEEMQRRFHADPRLAVLFEAVVASPQFRRQRGRDFVAASR